MFDKPNPFARGINENEYVEQRKNALQVFQNAYQAVASDLIAGNSEFGDEDSEGVDLMDAIDAICGYLEVSNVGRSALKYFRGLRPEQRQGFAHDAIGNYEGISS